ncbi:MAG: GNAT family N-acetyltransferase [Gemmatimonadota bacterium]
MIIRHVEPSDTKGGFRCGVPALDTFFSKRAWTQHNKDDANRVYVLVDEASGEVLGFYTLCAKEVARSRLEGIVSRSAPPHPLGVFYIGYFAVAESHQGRGLGRRLMADALRRCVEAADTIAAVGVFLDSLDDDSTAFYHRLGFVDIPRAPGAPEGGPQPMFLPMTVIRAARPVPP